MGVKGRMEGRMGVVPVPPPLPPVLPASEAS